MFTKEDYKTWIEAAIANDVYTLQKLLNEGIDPNCEVEERRALGFTIGRNNLESFKLLLSLPNIDVNFQDYYIGFSFLMSAIICNNIEIVNLLLQHPKTDITLTDSLNRTALDFFDNRTDVKIIQAVTEHFEKYKLNKKQKLIEKSWFDACYSGNVKHLKSLINRGFDINFQNSYGLTALKLCCEYQHIECVKMLLENPIINIDIKSNSGGTAICNVQNIVILNLFENYNNNIKTEKILDEIATSLIENKTQDNVKIFEKLSDFDKYYLNICYNFHLNVDKEYSDVELWFIASKKGYSKIIEYLINKGIDVNIQNFYGNTALILASEYIYINIVKLLLQQPNIHINIQNKMGYTAYDLADNKEIKDLLKKHVK